MQAVKRNKPTKIRNPNNNKNKNNNKIVKKRRRPRNNRMPVATTISTPKILNNIKVNGTTAIVSGCDLVYQVPDSLTTEAQNSQVITIIPCNPSYWTGTRVAAIASGYQNFRPTRFEVIYVPQCAVTQQGNVIAGTLWNQAPSTENLQQTLKTSNGGILTQCYKSANSTIKLGNNLQYNLYRMGGAIDQESNPFIFIALSIATTDTNNNRIIPGYFYVRYQFTFKNPIGTGIEYKNSQLINISSKEQYLLNAVLYLCEPIRTTNGLQIPIGSRIDIEYNNSVQNPGYNYLYNGTEVDLLLLRSVWVLENQPYSITTKLTQIPMKANIIEYSSTGNTGEEPTLEIPPNTGVIVDYSNNPQQWTSYINTSPWNTNWVPVGENENYYRLLDITQNLGTINQINNDGIMRLLADKLFYKLILQTTKKQPVKVKLHQSKSEPKNIKLKAIPEQKEDP